jgi:hypothetical protein
MNCSTLSPISSTTHGCFPGASVAPIDWNADQPLAQADFQSGNRFARGGWRHPLSQGRRGGVRPAAVFGTPVPALLPAVRHELPDRRSLSVGPVDAVSLHHHHGGGGARLRVGAYAGADEGRTGDPECWVLSRPFPARSAGAQARLGHGAEGIRQRTHRGRDVSPGMPGFSRWRTLRAASIPCAPSGVPAASI